MLRGTLVELCQMQVKKKGSLKQQIIAILLPDPKQMKRFYSCKGMLLPKPRSMCSHCEQRDNQSFPLSDQKLLGIQRVHH